MKISYILQIENKNKCSVFLYKEGLFWRAYERSAFLFIKNIKEYQTTKKYYKNVKSEVVYLGFPHNILSQILEIVKNKTINKEDNQIIIKGFQIKESDFILWKNNIELYNKIITRQYVPEPSISL